MVRWELSLKNWVRGFKSPGDAGYRFEVGIYFSADYADYADYFLLVLKLISVREMSPRYAAHQQKP